MRFLKEKIVVLQIFIMKELINKIKKNLIFYKTINNVLVFYHLKVLAL